MQERLLDQTTELGVALSAEVHVSDGIAIVIVLPGGVDDELRPELVEHGENHPIHDGEEALLRGPSRDRGTPAGGLLCKAA